MIMDKSEITREYPAGEITIVWRPALCIHAGVCWQTLPEVYKPAERPWVRPRFASASQLRAQIDACPSKALSYFEN
jgi:uncharacterized Fe-S cluster protein YjdI